jgi:hypothetical protein
LQVELARLWGWWARRPVLAAAVIYAVLSLVFVGQGLLPGRTLTNADMLWSGAPWTAAAPADVRFGGANFELADTTTVFLPFLDHAARTMPDFPVWNPYIMAGRPFLANAQSALFSPFTAPVYVLPFWKSLAVMAMLKLFVAAFGTFLFGRALGMRFGGALLAGVVFAFGTFFVVWLGWPLTNVFSLLPWLLLLTDLVVRRPGPLPAAGLAALTGLTFLGGHPETTFHVVGITLLFFAFRLWRAREAALRKTLVFGGALALGAALAAVMLIPLAELFLHSSDYARRIDTQPGHTEARFLGAFFLSDYWGRPTQTPLAGVVSNRGFYAGGITLMLASAALILRPTATRVAVAVLGALTFAVVLGIDPIFSVVTALPGFSTAHNGRLVFLLLFILALLAGWGLDDLSGRAPPSLIRGRVALAAAVAIFCIPLIWLAANSSIRVGVLGSALDVAWGFADPPPPVPGPLRDADALRAVGDPVADRTVDIIRLAALLEWLPLAGVGVVLVWLGVVRRWRVSAVVLVGCAVAVLAVDLFRANMGFNPAIPIEHAEQPQTPALRYLESRRPNRFAVLSRSGIDQPLQPDLSMRYRLYDARGYDYPVVRRYDEFWRASATTTGDFIEPTQRAGESRKALHALQLLSVTDLLHYPDGPAPSLPGLRLVYEGPDARVYRNGGALPRVFVVGSQRVVAGGDAALAATIDPGFDARRVAVTERPVPGLAVGGDGSGAGSARLVEYGEERARVEVAARRSALLVLTDVHFPGWEATVDGREVDIEQVDYLLRGVRVAAGRHLVEFRYRPASFTVGWVVSLLALIAIAATALTGWRRRSA